jgi:hypothetical protein
MAFFHLFLFPEKGGRGLVRTIFILTTQVLVHLQLQVRGGVSLGQYYSTVRAIHSPRVYIKIIIAWDAVLLEGFIARPSDLQPHPG